MKLLYCGSIACDEETFKRLILIADEIGFMDRPSHAFNKASDRSWGWVGVQTPMRHYTKGAYPISFSAYAPPAGPVSQLYMDYLQADIANPEFRSTVFEGFRTDPKFASKFLPPNQIHKSGTGEDIRRAIIGDPKIVNAQFRSPFDLDPSYRIGSPQECAETFEFLLVNISLELTDSILVSSHSGLLPVSDDPTLCRLIMLRSGSRAYIENVPRTSPLLGLAVARSVVPDKILKDISIEQLFEYRDSAKDAYQGWSVEIDRLAALIADMSPEEVERELPRVISTEVRPRVYEFQSQMESARDKLFGSLVKRLLAVDTPTLFLTQIVGLGLPLGILTFLATIGATAVPALVTYLQKGREIKRTNSMAYLIGASELPKG
ncbi:MAG: hypothetical protein ABSG63_07210 [Spirochaetia bacterium]